MKKVFKLQDIKNVIEYGQAINNIELSDIKLLDINNNIIKISKELIKEWEYSGLSNIDFIAHYYLDGES